MAALQRTTYLDSFRISRANPASGRASYAGSVTNIQLRQALAEAEALLHEKDLLIQAVLTWQETATNHLAGLTRRQRQVMDLVLAGQPSKNIAADLGISQRTVENHRAAIMKRTGSTCLAALARMALGAAWDDAAAPLPDAANQSWSSGNEVIALCGTSTPNTRQGASVTSTLGRKSSDDGTTTLA